MMPREMGRLAIIGLGNEYISDDGAGVWTVRGVQCRLSARGTGCSDVAFLELATGGFQLLDHLLGFDECILVDAVWSGAHPPGTVYRFIQTPDRPLARWHSSHQVDLPQILELARMLGARIPRKITVYGIEAADITTFSTQCTEEVQESIEELIDIIDASLAPAATGPPGDTRTEVDGWEIIRVKTSHIR